MFGGLGTTEILIILAILILLFGAKQLPKLARGFGEARREFKNGWRDLEDDWREDDKENSRVRPQIKG